jgi:hypothetical protein
VPSRVFHHPPALIRAEPWGKRGGHVASFQARWLVAGFVLVLAACGGKSPTSPGPVSQVVPTGPRLLLAGNSNAYFLAPLLLPNVIDQSNIEGSIDFWLNSPVFAEAARTPNLAALIWWQAGSDIFTPGDEYAAKLRRVIRIARSSHEALPVRIVELPDLPNRTVLRDVQRQVARDPGVELIPTADLEWADAVGHFTPAALQTVRDRIFRSLGL